MATSTGKAATGKAKAPAFSPREEKRTAPFAVAILGAGFGGLGMAARLKERGETNFVVLEKADRVGGTWRDNTYPGCACDVPSHLYSYSFETNAGWSRKYSPQDEILAYIERVCAKRDLDRHIRFGAEVTEAAWDEGEQVWRIRLSGGETVTARSFVAAWGQLNRPSIPEIPGRAGFKGAQFHSARWDHGVDLRGKRIAVIGNGASAIQFVPQIAPEAGHLTLFQRTPNWIAPRMDRAYRGWEKALLKVPPVFWASRGFKYWWKEYGWAAFTPGSKMAQKFVDGCKAYLEAVVPDPALRAKLTPDYAIGCKRILISDDFLPALTRDNVEVETAAIAKITPAGVQTKDGVTHAADVIIWATGFETNSFMGMREIIGLGGVKLSDAWREAPKAYLGLTVAGFPNFFMLYGPNTNLGHNSIIFMLERQIDYVLAALDQLKARGARALTLNASALDRFYDDLQAKLSRTAFAAGCSSWYKTAAGHITNNWSGRTTEYAKRTKRLAVEDYEFS